MKDRITLTIDKDVLEKIDKKIDGSRVNNRSQAVELLLLKALSANRPKKAIILAGGLFSETRKTHTVTPMMKIDNKSLLEWNIELMRLHGVKEVMICINKDNKEIKEYFGSGKNGVKIYYLEEEYPLGTAGPLKVMGDFFNETIILSNGDELKNINLDDMYEFHKEHNKTCTIALTTVEDPSKYGVAIMNGHKVLSFIEKPLKDKSPSNLVNAGLYFMEPEILKYIPDGFAALEQDVFPKLATQDKLLGYIFSGQWFSPKTNEDLDKAKEWKGYE